MLFTTDTTRDFTAADLRTLNAAADQLLPDYADAPDGEAEKTVSDRLTNAWQDGNTVEELVRAARRD